MMLLHAPLSLALSFVHSNKAQKTNKKGHFVESIQEIFQNPSVKVITISIYKDKSREKLLEKQQIVINLENNKIVLQGTDKSQQKYFHTGSAEFSQKANSVESASFEFFADFNVDLDKGRLDIAALNNQNINEDEKEAGFLFANPDPKRFFPFLVPYAILRTFNNGDKRRLLQVWKKTKKVPTELFVVPRAQLALAESKSTKRRELSKSKYNPLYLQRHLKLLGLDEDTYLDREGLSKARRAYTQRRKDLKIDSDLKQKTPAEYYDVVQAFKAVKEHYTFHSQHVAQAEAVLQKAALLAEGEVLSAEVKKAIYRAHLHGQGLPGADGRLAGLGNYPSHINSQKLWIVLKALARDSRARGIEFDKKRALKIAKALADQGVIGETLVERRITNASAPAQPIKARPRMVKPPKLARPEVARPKMARPKQVKPKLLKKELSAEERLAEKHRKQENNPRTEPKRIILSEEGEHLPNYSELINDLIPGDTVVLEDSDGKVTEFILEDPGEKRFEELKLSQERKRKRDGGAYPVPRALLGEGNTTRVFLINGGKQVLRLPYLSLAIQQKIDAHGQKFQFRPHILGFLNNYAANMKALAALDVPVPAVHLSQENLFVSAERVEGSVTIGDWMDALPADHNWGDDPKLKALIEFNRHLSKTGFLSDFHPGQLLWIEAEKKWVLVDIGDQKVGPSTPFSTAESHRLYFKSLAEMGFPPKYIDQMYSSLDEDYKRRFPNAEDYRRRYIETKAKVKLLEESPAESLRKVAHGKVNKLVLSWLKPESVDFKNKANWIQRKAYELLLSNVKKHYEKELFKIQEGAAEEYKISLAEVGLSAGIDFEHNSDSLVKHHAQKILSTGQSPAVGSGLNIDYQTRKSVNFVRRSRRLGIFINQDIQDINRNLSEEGNPSPRQLAYDERYETYNLEATKFDDPISQAEFNKRVWAAHNINFYDFDNPEDVIKRKAQILRYGIDSEGNPLTHSTAVERMPLNQVDDLIVRNLVGSEEKITLKVESFKEGGKLVEYSAQGKQYIASYFATDSMSSQKTLSVVIVDHENKTYKFYKKEFLKIQPEFSANEMAKMARELDGQQAQVYFDDPSYFDEIKELTEKGYAFEGKVPDSEHLSVTNIRGPPNSSSTKDQAKLLKIEAEAVDVLEVDVADLLRETQQTAEFRANFNEVLPKEFLEARTKTLDLVSKDKKELRRILKKLQSPDAYSRQQRKDYLSYAAQLADPKSNIALHKKITIGDKEIYITKTLRDSVSTREIALAVTKGEDGKYRVLTYYLSESQGVWRVATGISAGGLLGKGVFEDDTKLSFELESALNNNQKLQLAEGEIAQRIGTTLSSDGQHIIGENIDFVEVFSSKFDGSGTLRPSLERLKDPGSFAFKDPRFEIDFSKQALPSRTASEGIDSNITYEYYYSKGEPKILYTIRRLDDGKITISGEFIDAPMTASGRRTKVPSLGYLTSPAYEYREQIIGKVEDAEKLKGNRDQYVSNWEFLGRIPAVQEYYAARAIDLEAQGIKTKLVDGKIIVSNNNSATKNKAESSGPFTIVSNSYLEFEESKKVDRAAVLDRLSNEKSPMRIKNTVKVGGRNFHFSDRVQEWGGRQYVFAYVENTKGQATLHAYYKSNSQNEWRVLPAIKKTQSGYRYSKTTSEASVKVSPAIEKAIRAAELADVDGDLVLETVKAVSPQIKKGYLQEFEDAREVLNLTKSDAIDKRAPANSNDARAHFVPETLKFTDVALEPDFNNLLSSTGPEKSPFGHELVTEKYAAKGNDKLVYTILRDRITGQIFFQGADYLEIAINDYGTPKVVADLRAMGQPLMEYRHLIHRDYRNMTGGIFDIKNDMYASAWMSLQKVPIIKEYYKSREAELAKEGIYFIETTNGVETYSERIDDYLEQKITELKEMYARYPDKKHLNTEKIRLGIERRLERERRSKYTLDFEIKKNKFRPKGSPISETSLANMSGLYDALFGETSKDDPYVFSLEALKQNQSLRRSKRAEKLARLGIEVSDEIVQKNLGLSDEYFKLEASPREVAIRDLYQKFKTHNPDSIRISEDEFTKRVLWAHSVNIFDLDDDFFSPEETLMARKDALKQKINLIVDGYKTDESGKTVKDAFDVVEASSKLDKDSKQRVSPEVASAVLTLGLAGKTTSEALVISSLRAQPQYSSEFTTVDKQDALASNTLSKKVAVNDELVPTIRERQAKSPADDLAKLKTLPKLADTSPHRKKADAFVSKKGLDFVAKPEAIVVDGSPQTTSAPDSNANYYVYSPPKSFRPRTSDLSSPLAKPSSELVIPEFTFDRSVATVPKPAVGSAVSVASSEVNRANTSQLGTKAPKLLENSASEQKPVAETAVSNNAVEAKAKVPTLVQGQSQAIKRADKIAVTKAPELVKPFVARANDSAPLGISEASNAGQSVKAEPLVQTDVIPQLGQSPAAVNSRPVNSPQVLQALAPAKPSLGQAKRSVAVQANQKKQIAQIPRARTREVKTAKEKTVAVANRTQQLAQLRQQNSLLSAAQTNIARQQARSFPQTKTGDLSLSNSVQITQKAPVNLNSPRSLTKKDAKVSPPPYELSSKPSNTSRVPFVSPVSRKPQVSLGFAPAISNKPSLSSSDVLAAAQANRIPSALSPLPVQRPLSAELQLPAVIERPPATNTDVVIANPQAAQAGGGTEIVRRQTTELVPNIPTTESSIPRRPASRAERPRTSTAATTSRASRGASLAQIAHGYFEDGKGGFEDIKKSSGRAALWTAAAIDDVVAVAQVSGLSKKITSRTQMSTYNKARASGASKKVALERAKNQTSGLGKIAQATGVGGSAFMGLVTVDQIKALQQLKKDGASDAELFQQRARVGINSYLTASGLTTSLDSTFAKGRLQQSLAQASSNASNTIRSSASQVAKNKLKGGATRAVAKRAATREALKQVGKLGAGTVAKASASAALRFAGPIGWAYTGAEIGAAAIEGRSQAYYGEFNSKLSSYGSRRRDVTIGSLKDDSQVSVKLDSAHEIDVELETLGRYGAYDKSQYNLAVNNLAGIYARYKALDLDPPINIDTAAKALRSKSFFGDGQFIDPSKRNSSAYKSTNSASATWGGYGSTASSFDSNAASKASIDDFKTTLKSRIADRSKKIKLRYEELGISQSDAKKIADDAGVSTADFSKEYEKQLRFDDFTNEKFQKKADDSLRDFKKLAKEKLNEVQVTGNEYEKFIAKKQYDELFNGKDPEKSAQFSAYLSDSFKKTQGSRAKAKTKVEFELSEWERKNPEPGWCVVDCDEKDKWKKNRAKRESELVGKIEIHDSQSSANKEMAKSYVTAVKNEIPLNEEEQARLRHLKGIEIASSQALSNRVQAPSFLEEGLFKDLADEVINYDTTKNTLETAKKDIGTLYGTVSARAIVEELKKDPAASGQSLVVDDKTKELIKAASVDFAVKKELNPHLGQRIHSVDTVSALKKEAEKEFRANLPDQNQTELNPEQKTRVAEIYQAKLDARFDNDVVLASSEKLKRVLGVSENVVKINQALVQSGIDENSINLLRENYREAANNLSLNPEDTEKQLALNASLSKIKGEIAVQGVLDKIQVDGGDIAVIPEDVQAELVQRFVGAYDNEAVGEEAYNEAIESAGTYAHVVGMAAQSQDNAAFTQLEVYEDASAGNVEAYQSLENREFIAQENTSRAEFLESNDKNVVSQRDLQNDFEKIANEMVPDISDEDRSQLIIDLKERFSASEEVEQYPEKLKAFSQAVLEVTEKHYRKKAEIEFADLLGERGIDSADLTEDQQEKLLLTLSKNLQDKSLNDKLDADALLKLDENFISALDVETRIADLSQSLSPEDVEALKLAVKNDGERAFAEFEEIAYNMNSVEELLEEEDALNREVASVDGLESDEFLNEVEEEGASGITGEQGVAGEEGILEDAKILADAEAVLQAKDYVTLPGSASDINFIDSDVIDLVSLPILDPETMNLSSDLVSLPETVNVNEFVNVSSTEEVAAVETDTNMVADLPSESESELEKLPIVATTDIIETLSQDEKIEGLEATVLEPFNDLLTGDLAVNDYVSLDVVVNPESLDVPALIASPPEDLISVVSETNSVEDSQVVEVAKISAEDPDVDEEDGTESKEGEEVVVVTAEESEPGEGEQVVATTAEESEEVAVELVEENEAEADEDEKIAETDAKKKSLASADEEEKAVASADDKKEKPGLLSRAGEFLFGSSDKEDGSQGVVGKAFGAVAKTFSAATAVITKGIDATDTFLFGKKDDEGNRIAGAEGVVQKYAGPVFGGIGKGIGKVGRAVLDTVFRRKTIENDRFKDRKITLSDGIKAGLQKQLSEFNAADSDNLSEPLDKNTEYKDETLTDKALTQIADEETTQLISEHNIDPGECVTIGGDVAQVAEAAGTQTPGVDTAVNIPAAPQAYESQASVPASDPASTGLNATRERIYEVQENLNAHQNRQAQLGSEQKKSASEYIEEVSKQQRNLQGGAFGQVASAELCRLFEKNSLSSTEAALATHGVFLASAATIGANVQDQLDKLNGQEKILDDYLYNVLANEGDFIDAFLDETFLIQGALTILSKFANQGCEGSAPGTVGQVGATLLAIKQGISAVKAYETFSREEDPANSRDDLQKAQEMIQQFQNLGNVVAAVQTIAAATQAAQASRAVDGGSACVAVKASAIGTTAQFAGLIIQALQFGQAIKDGNLSKSEFAMQLLGLTSSVANFGAGVAGDNAELYGKIGEYSQGLRAAVGIFGANDKTCESMTTNLSQLTGTGGQLFSDVRGASFTRNNIPMGYKQISSTLACRVVGESIERASTKRKVSKRNTASRNVFDRGASSPTNSPKQSTQDSAGFAVFGY